MFSLWQTLSAQNAATAKLISGLRRHAQEMKQKPNSSNAQSASILGESIGDSNQEYNINQ